MWGNGLGKMNLGNVISHSIIFHVSCLLITHHMHLFLQLGSNSHIKSELAGDFLKCIPSRMLIKKIRIKTF